jgi:hypothetical protein
VPCSEGARVAAAMIKANAGLDHGGGYTSRRCPRGKHRTDSGKGSVGLRPQEEVHTGPTR